MLPRLDRLRVYARSSAAASASTGAPQHPRTFKPSLGDKDEELDNFARDIERPQDLTPEKVQEMIRKGELPPPSKRPQAQLAPRVNDDDADEAPCPGRDPPPGGNAAPPCDDDEEPPSWDVLHAEMQRRLKVYEARDKELTERRKRLFGRRGAASTGEFVELEEDEVEDLNGRGDPITFEPFSKKCDKDGDKDEVDPCEPAFRVWIADELGKKGKKSKVYLARSFWRWIGVEGHRTDPITRQPVWRQDWFELRDKYAPDMKAPLWVHYLPVREEPLPPYYKKDTDPGIVTYYAKDDDRTLRIDTAWSTERTTPSNPLYMYNEFEGAKGKEARRKLVTFSDDGSVSQVRHFEGERGKEYMVKSEVYNQYDPYVVHYLGTTRGKERVFRTVYVSGRELRWEGDKNEERLVSKSGTVGDDYVHHRHRDLPGFNATLDEKYERTYTGDKGSEAIVRINFANPDGLRATMLFKPRQDARYPLNESSTLFMVKYEMFGYDTAGRMFWKGDVAEYVGEYPNEALSRVTRFNGDVEIYSGPSNKELRLARIPKEVVGSVTFEGYPEEEMYMQGPVLILNQPEEEEEEEEEMEEEEEESDDDGPVHLELDEDDYALVEEATNRDEEEEAETEEEAAREARWAAAWAERVAALEAARPPPRHQEGRRLRSGRRYPTRR